MSRKTRVHYSETFKRQVIEELEQGKLRNQTEARQRYGIGGGSTIGNWLRKYRRDDLLPRVVRIESMKERDRIKQLERRIRQLETALVNREIDCVIAESYFKVLAEEKGITDIEGYKKKLASKLPKKVLDS